MADTHHCQIKLRRELFAARPKKLASGVSVRNAMFVASSEEKPQSELTRLRKEQNKARHDEVFGGLWPVELAAYNGKAERIHELENYFQASAFAKKC